MPIKLKSTSHLSRSCPVAKTDREAFGLHASRTYACVCIAGSISDIDMPDLVAARQSVVDLLEAIISAIVTPLNEDGPVINARAVLTPSLETGMRSGKRCLR